MSSENAKGKSEKSSCETIIDLFSNCTPATDDYVYFPVKNIGICIREAVKMRRSNEVLQRKIQKMVEFDGLEDPEASNSQP